ncbi:metallophosphoesterase [Candidatus Dependentiae bacterium]|nr:metallophosphoesterase [Candidatus Dependentiae bacterium]
MKLQFIKHNINIDKNVEEVIISGDPGCDGYNTENIAIFEEILKIQADMHIIDGDMLVTGGEMYFKQFSEIVNTSSSAPVYCLPGNHDIKDYEKFFGLKNYYIKYNNVMFIMLDNSKRFFDNQTIDFLKESLIFSESKEIIILFHIPPENPYVPNSISNEEWQKLKGIIDPFKNQIKLIICAHIHTAFEYILDGYKIIVTGGAGSKLDPVKNTFFEKNFYNALRLTFKNSEFKYEVIKIDICYGKTFYENQDVITKLKDSFKEECSAFRKYLLYSEIAENEGFHGISKLFKAAASSEFYHSKNMFIAAGRYSNTLQNLAESIKTEKSEAEIIYPSNINLTEKEKSLTAVTSYKNALDAEKVHFKLFNEAAEQLKKGNDIPLQKYFICSRCGYMTYGDKQPARCPACGADMFKFIEEK